MCLVVILFSGAFAPVAQISSLIETAQAITNEANATAEAIRRQNYQAQPAITEQAMSPINGGLEPLYFRGRGDDLLFVDIPLDSYPYLYATHSSRGYFGVTGYDEKDKSTLLINTVGDFSGMLYLGARQVDHVATVEIQGQDWELLFLPASSDSIKTYQAPVTITGNEPAVFFVENMGNLMEAEFVDSGYAGVTQYPFSGRRNLLINTVAPYAGKVKTTKGTSLLEIQSKGQWSLNIYDPSNIKPEKIVAIEHSIADDLKSVSSEAAVPNQEPEVEIIQARLGQKINCGDKFEFIYYYQPIMTKSQSYQTAVGKFLMVRVYITNMTHEKIEGLASNSFTITGVFNGLKESFKLDAGASWSTSYKWEIGQTTDDFIPGVKVDTYLVFDVPAKADEWYLTFEPRDNPSSRSYCSVRMSVPKINYVD